MTKVVLGKGFMPRKLSEERTRKELIDPQLERAGWYLRDHAKVKTEITACPDALFGVDGYYAEPWNGISDCTLYRENGEVLAVVSSTTQITRMRLINILPNKEADNVFEDI